MTGAELVPAVRLFARLLRREPDAELLAELRAPEVTATLGALGVALPEDAELEEVCAQYVELLLHPRRGAPPVASLWVDGRYEGDTAIALRKVAEAAGCTFDTTAASGVPADHLGCILDLWCTCATDHPDLANLIAHDYLAWVDRALGAAGAADGFYGQVARATLGLVRELRASAQSPTG